MKPQYTRYYTYIKPILRNKYVKTYSSFIFSLITITIFSIFAIRPTISTIISLQKGIEEQNQTLDKIKGKSDQLTLAKQNYEALDNTSKQNIRSLIPESTSLPELLNVLSNLIILNQASSSGIQVESVDLENTSGTLSKKPTLKEVQFSINIQGSYEKLSTILDRMGKLSRLVKVQTANFNQPTEGSLILSITGKAFYLKN
jgi:Tfp pilus assembly protein PilO